MGNIFQLVGPHHVVQLFGVKLVGVNAENGKKLLFSIVFIAFVAFSDAAFAVIVTIMLLELKAPDQASFSALASVAYGHWLWREPSLHGYHWINHHHLMRFVGPRHCPSLHALASAICYSMRCARPACLGSCCVLRGPFVCIHVAYNVFRTSPTFP